MPTFAVCFITFSSCPRGGVSPVKTTATFGGSSNGGCGHGLGFVFVGVHTLTEGVDDTAKDYVKVSGELERQGLSRACSRRREAGL